METVINQNIKTSKKMTVRGIVLLSVLGFISLLAILFIITAFRIPKDVVASGVYADGIHLGGMTREQVQETLAGHDFYMGRIISVETENRKASVRAEEISLTADTSSTAERAYNVCKDGNVFTNTCRFIGLKFKKHQVIPVGTANTEQLTAFLYGFGKQINGELSQHELIMEENSARIIPGHAGQSEDVSKAYDTVLRHINEDDFEEIHISLEKQTPVVFDAASLREFIHCDVQNASYSVKDNVLTVVPEKAGIDVEQAEAEDKAPKIKEGGEPVTIQIVKTMPSITEAELRSKIFTGELAHYSSKYNPKKTNRSHNVALAAQKINGKILAPGEVFSYNDTVGRRTIANGFLNAPVYENGKSVDGIGGGVCQVSSTLYSAVLYADLGIVTRSNHSLPVSYVPLGQDATVADGSIDFKFQNTTDYPIKIEAAASNGTVTISLIGTPVGNKEVKVSHAMISSTAAGQTVQSTKTVYENGVKISEKSLGKSFYKKSETPSPSPTVSPSPTPASEQSPAEIPAAVPPAA